MRAPDDGTSDGFHTFGELYAHRTALFAALCRAFPWMAGRSWEHHPGQGEMYPGMFVAWLDTPAGQVSYHCEAETWPLFTGVATYDVAPPWDGRTPDDVLTRLRSLR